MNTRGNTTTPTPSGLKEIRAAMRRTTTTKPKAAVALADLGELGELAIELWNTRGQIKAAKKVDAAAQEWCRAWHDAGVSTVNGIAVVRTITAHHVEKLRFDTAGLKKARRADYERCRVLTPIHAIKNLKITPPVNDYGSLLPAVPAIATEATLGPRGLLGQHWVSLQRAHDEKMRLRGILCALRNREDELKANLEAAVEPYLLQRGWDGQPYEFTDGYVYGCRALRFSPEVAMDLLDAAVVERYCAIVAPRDVVTVTAIDPANPGAVFEPFGVESDAGVFEGN